MGRMESSAETGREARGSYWFCSCQVVRAAYSLAPARMYVPPVTAATDAQKAKNTSALPPRTPSSADAVKRIILCEFLIVPPPVHIPLRKVPRARIALGCGVRSPTSLPLPILVYPVQLLSIATKDTDEHSPGHGDTYCRLFHHTLPHMLSQMRPPPTMSLKSTQIWHVAPAP